METLNVNPKNVLKPTRTLIEVNQAIANLTQLNTDGQYTERLLELSIEKVQILTWNKQNYKPAERIVYKPSANEEKAIEAFYANKRYKLTE